MPQNNRLSRFILLPELKLLNTRKLLQGKTEYLVEKVSELEVCPKCASTSKSIYDRRWVKIHDAPIRGIDVRLIIRKRRFYCKNCKKPFTEPVQGIRKGKRTTE
ncbi:MAG: transposase, partial [Bdellovibrionales bacterium]|nr:transposase [Bdellovibrionales bacterium]